MAELVTRRDFVRQGALAGAGLVLAVRFPTDVLGASEVVSGSAATFRPNAWIRIASDGLVHIVVDEAEMGQGVRTAVPIIVAEELGADWSSVRAEPAPTDPSSWPRTVATGGSTSVRLGWMPLRRAGAAAREMLREAAAREWGAAVDRCRVESGVVHGPNGESLGFGELAARAAELPVPEDPPLKSPDEFTLVGASLPRVDLADKGTGATVFGTDFRTEGMLFATVALPPAFGATVASVDGSRALGMDGVRHVVELDDAVAVVAESTWAALEARDALSLEWDRSGATDIDTATMSSEAADLLGRPGEVVDERGDADGALAGAARRVEAEYELPFLDHAPMEPMNCTAVVRDDGVEVWVPTQVATAAQRAAARVAGVEPGDVTLNSLLIGGGFGRRLQVDYVEQAVAIARRLPGTPVQLFWTREDTTRHGFYRPYTRHRMVAGLDAGGRPVAWTHRVVGEGPSGLVAGGADAAPYDLPAFRVEVHDGEWGVPVGALRSVGYTQNGFTVESFIDELAHAANRDPYEYRRELMTDERLRAVLDLAADRAGWGEPLPDDGGRRGRGIAAIFSYGGYVAEVAEVTVSDAGEVAVDRVVCAVDCGITVNPNAVEAQIEGGVAFALSAVLKGAITLRDGGVVEGNFTDYPMVTFKDMPHVEVHRVESTEPPGGVGEPGVPPLAPAVANAVFDATGVRVRKLPVGGEGLARG